MKSRLSRQVNIIRIARQHAVKPIPGRYVYTYITVGVKK